MALTDEEIKKIGKTAADSILNQMLGHKTSVRHIMLIEQIMKMKNDPTLICWINDVTSEEEKKNIIALAKANNVDVKRIFFTKEEMEKYLHMEME